MIALCGNLNHPLSLGVSAFPFPPSILSPRPACPCNFSRCCNTHNRRRPLPGLFDYHSAGATSLRQRIPISTASPTHHRFATTNVRHETNACEPRTPHRYASSNAPDETNLSRCRTLGGPSGTNFPFGRRPAGCVPSLVKRCSPRADADAHARRRPTVGPSGLSDIQTTLGGPCRH
jgi:hypothetical protein